MLRNEYRVIGTAAIAGMLGWAAWRSGLFFDAHAYLAELILFAAAVAAGFYSMSNKHDGANRPAVLFPLAIAACYGMALLLEPASVKGTTDSMLRWTAFAAWAAVLSWWWRAPENRAWGEGAIQACGVFLLAGGWFGWFGWLSFPDIVLRFDDPELSATGARLAGFLQYPNAYGAVLAFFLVRQWQLWASGGKAAGILACLTAVPYAGALVLTESRGSVAALAVGFVLALVFAGNRRVRARIVYAFGWTVAGGVFAARGALSWVEGGDGGGWLAAGSIFAGAAILSGIRLRLDRIERLGEAGRGRADSRFERLIGAGMLVAVLAFIWTGGLGVEERTTGGTAASRMLFYRDGWNMFLDSPWFGSGGDSWRSLFGLYQSEPYVGGEIHSGYLEILLDIGLVGFAVFAAMLVYWIRKVWTSRREALAPAAVLLAHAAVDFDLSFAWVWLLLFAWFALFAADELYESARGWRAGRLGAAALLIGASAWGAWAAWHGDAAARAYAAADQAAAPSARAASLRAALEANPAWTRIRLALAPLLPEAEERESVLAAGLRHEPQSAPLMLRLGLAAAEQGHVAQAELRLREALRLERYSREGQTAAIAAMVRLAETHRFQGRADEARGADEAAASFYESYSKLVRQVGRMDHPSNGKRFAMTPSAEFNAAKAYAALERFDSARPLLQRLIQGDDTSWKEQAQQLLDQINSQP